MFGCTRCFVMTSLRSCVRFVDSCLSEKDRQAFNMVVEPKLFEWSIAQDLTQYVEMPSKHHVSTFNDFNYDNAVGWDESSTERGQAREHQTRNRHQPYRRSADLSRR